MIAKEFIGYRYGSYKTDGGYRMHEIQVYHLEPMSYQGPTGRLWANDLFTITMQSGRGYNDGPAAGPHDREIFTESYGLRIESLKITHRAAYKALRPFVDVNDMHGCHRAVIKALRKLKAVKIVYDAKESSFLPAKYKSMKELYFAAAKNGLELSKVA